MDKTTIRQMVVVWTEEQYERLKVIVNSRFDTYSRPEFDTRLDQSLAFQRKFGHTRVPPVV
jgi:hypothetical protein